MRRGPMYSRATAPCTGTHGGRVGYAPYSPAVSLSGAACLRLDVLVQPEHIRRVVMVLQRNEAGVRLVAVRGPRGVPVTEEVDVRAPDGSVRCSRDHGPRPFRMRRPRVGVAPSATRATAPPIWWTWISHCGPGEATWISASRSISSSSSRARFVALK